MEQNKDKDRDKDHWVVWYPSYTHKDFELIDRDNEQPIIEDLTDSYFSDTHTYLKIETYYPDEQTDKKEKESIRLFFYKIERKRTYFFRFSLWLFCKGFLKDRPPIQSINNIEEQLSSNKPVAIVELIYKNHSSNGLFVYECSTDDEKSKKFLSDDSHSLSDDTNQYPTFYSLKQLYHTHLFHKKSNQNNQYKDYYFKAFLKKGETNVQDANNEAIKFYLTKILEHFELQLQHFEEIRTNTNSDIRTKNRRINKDIKILQGLITNTPGNDEISLRLKAIWKSEIIKRKKAREFYINIIKTKNDKEELLFKTSNAIIGESLFTNVLCCSKYLDKRNDEVRRLVLNIENVKIGLQYIRDNYKYLYDEKASNKSLKFGKIGYWVGFLGVLMTVYTFWKADKSSQEQQEKIESLFQKQDSIINNMMNRTGDCGSSPQ